jgi:hypothetical protein
MLPEAAFGLADERGHIELQQQTRRIERCLGAAAAPGD